MTVRAWKLKKGEGQTLAGGGSAVRMVVTNKGPHNVQITSTATFQLRMRQSMVVGSLSAGNDIYIEANGDGSANGTFEVLP